MGFFQNRDYNRINEYFNAITTKKSEFNLKFHLKSWLQFQEYQHSNIQKSENKINKILTKRKQIIFYFSI